MATSSRLIALCVLVAVGVVAGVASFAVHEHYPMAVALVAAFFAADVGYWKRVPARQSSDS